MGSAPATATVDPQAVLEEAIAALKTRQFADALPALERAIRVAPSDARLLHVAAMIHRRLDRRELALPLLDRAVALAPAEPMIVHARAQTMFEAGLPSVEAFGQALRLKAKDPGLLLSLCAALVAERRIEEAMAGLERVLKASPLWTEGHVTLSQLRWTEGERRGFARSFDEALARHPTNNNNLRWHQLTTLLHAEQFEEVLRVAAEGRRVGDTEIMLAANEAAAHIELGNTAEADRLLAPLEHLNEPTLQVRRVRHFLRCGRPDRAAEVVEPWLAGPDQNKFWPYAATAWRLTGDPRWQWLEGDKRFVGVYDIADRLPPLGELAAALRQLHTTRGQPLEQSVRGGTQTDGHLFQRIEPIFVQLREAIRETVAEHAAQLPAHDTDHPLLRPPRGPIAFSGAWSVRLQAGGRHANHVHPQGWLSSALYVVLPPDLGENDAGLLTLGEPELPLPQPLPPIRMVEPRPGRLVLFPSTMWHGTRPFGTGERMTVAFDVAVPS